MNAKIKKTLVDQKDYWTNVEYGDFSADLSDMRFFRFMETQYHHEVRIFELFFCFENLLAVLLSIVYEVN